MKKYLVVLSLLMSISGLLAQTNYTIADFMPVQAGDSLHYQNLLDAESPYILGYPTLVDHNGMRVMKQSDSQGLWRYQTVDDITGLIIYHMGAPGDTEITFERPVTLFPTVVSQGSIYFYEVDYNRFTKGVASGKGKYEFEIEIHGSSSAKTPLKNFSDCLVITTTAIQKQPDAQQQSGYKIKEWYARGVGLVKAAGERFTIANGKKESQKIAFMLESAKVQGNWVNGRTPAQQKH